MQLIRQIFPLFPQLTLSSFSFNTFNALIVQILPLCNHLSGNISATPTCNACGQNAHSITLPHPCRNRISRNCVGMKENLLDRFCQRIALSGSPTITGKAVITLSYVPLTMTFRLSRRFPSNRPTHPLLSHPEAKKGSLSNRARLSFQIQPLFRFTSGNGCLLAASSLVVLR